MMTKTDYYNRIGLRLDASELEFEERILYLKNLYISQPEELIEICQAGSYIRSCFDATSSNDKLDFFKDLFAKVFSLPINLIVRPYGKVLFFSPFPLAWNLFTLWGSLALLNSFLVYHKGPFAYLEYAIIVWVCLENTFANQLPKELEICNAPDHAFPSVWRVLLGTGVCWATCTAIYLSTKSVFPVLAMLPAFGTFFFQLYCLCLNCRHERNVQYISRACKTNPNLYREYS